MQSSQSTHASHRREFSGILKFQRFFYRLISLLIEFWKHVSFLIHKGYLFECKSMTADVALPQKWFDFQMDFFVIFFRQPKQFAKRIPKLGATPIHPFLSTCANSEVRLVWLVDLSVLGVSVGTWSCAVPAPTVCQCFRWDVHFVFVFMVFPIPMIFSYVLLNVFFPK